MGKSKKPKHSPNKSLPRVPAIQFEIEENALELMEQHLEMFKPSAKSADRPRQTDHAKRVSTSTVEIDLHGLTLEQAERRVMETIERHPFDQMERTFKIITGKGRHSQAGRGVLVREIHLFVRQRFGPHIVRIEESPDDVRIGGHAIRGHFYVTLKGP